MGYKYSEQMERSNMSLHKKSQFKEICKMNPIWTLFGNIIEVKDDL